MMQDVYCEQLCMSNLGDNDLGANTMTRAIRNKYHHNWLVDNLPAASKMEDDTTVTTRYWGGMPIGFIASDTNKAYIFNHMNFEIHYSDETDPDNKGYIVRVVAQPFSIKHEFEDAEVDSDYPFKINDPIRSCNDTSEMSWEEKFRSRRDHTRYEMLYPPDVETDPFLTSSFDARNFGQIPQPSSGRVLFTYDVIWIKNVDQKEDQRWNTDRRWNIYLTMDYAVPNRVHYLSIINSLVMLMILSAIVVMRMICNLRYDVNTYRRIVTVEDKAESIIQFSWKLIHADVFRPPRHSLLLAVCCGSGAQLLCTALCTSLLSFFGFFSSAQPGSIAVGGLIIFAICGGVVAGYVSLRYYHTIFKGKMNWRSVATYTSLTFPGLLFGTWLVIEIMALWHRSTLAVPWMCTLILLFLWLGVLTPLVYIGAYFGSKHDMMEFPCKTSSTARKIPTQSRWSRSGGSLVVAILSYGSIFTESYFIFSTIWHGQYFSSFGALFSSILLMSLISMVGCILFGYHQLCWENHKWWWHSFVAGGSAGLILFCYCCVSGFPLQLNLALSSDMKHHLASPILIYIGVTGMISLALFLMLGFVGMTGMLWFNKVVYSSIITDGGNIPSTQVLQSGNTQQGDSPYIKNLIFAALCLTTLLIPAFYYPSQLEDYTVYFPSYSNDITYDPPPYDHVDELDQPLNDKLKDGIEGIKEHDIAEVERRLLLEDPNIDDLFEESGLSSEKTQLTSMPFRCGTTLLRTFEHDSYKVIVFGTLLWIGMIAFSIVRKRRSARAGGKIYNSNQAKVHKTLTERRRQLRDILSDPVLLNDMQYRYGDLTALICLVEEWKKNGFQVDKKNDCIKNGRSVVVPWIRYMNILLILSVFVSYICLYGHLLVSKRFSFVSSCT